MFVNSERYSGVLRDQLKSAIRKKTPWFVALWRVSAAWQRSSSRSHSYRETDTGFKIGGLIPSAICSRFVTHRSSPLLAPKRRHVRPRPIRWGKGRSAWLSGISAKGLLLFPRNLCVNETKEAACRSGEVQFEDKCHRTVYIFAINHFT